MKDKLAKLIDLKSILTMSLVITLEILVLGYFFTNGILEEKLFLLFSNIVTNCFTFYFTRKAEDNKNE